MKRRRIVVAIAVVLLAVSTRATAIDFPAGSLSGSVVSNDAFVNSQMSRYVYVIIPGFGDGNISATGQYAFPALPPGPYEVIVGVMCTGRELGRVPAVVTAGQSTVATPLDISGMFGRIVGTITVNGQPFPNPRISGAPTCSWDSQSDGSFSATMPSGTYSASVSGPSGQLGSFTFTIVGGQTTSLGSIKFDSGSLSGSVVSNDAFVNSQMSRYVYVIIPGFGDGNISATGQYAFPALPPGPYEVIVGVMCTGRELGRVPAVVTAGQSTVATPLDISGMFGRIVGTITVNGQPFPNPRISGAPTCSWDSQSDGSFSATMPSGTYSASVSGPSGQLGSFTFTIVGGQTTSLGSIKFDSGSLSGSVVSNDAFVNSQMSRYVYVIIPGFGDGNISATGQYAFPALPPGPYEVIVGVMCTGRELGRVPAVVTAGQSTVATPLDISGMFGRIVGTITVNGQPFPNPRISGAPTCSWDSQSDGSFSATMPSGTYSASVSGPSGQLGSFTFTIVGGQTTIVDFYDTPPGSDITVNLDGGTNDPGGVRIVFDTVTGGGSTVIAESGTGPAPPTGYSVVGLNGGPRYFDLETSATYQGEIEVCFRYDVSQLRGDENRLELRHYSQGNQWEDITVRPIDTANNIICGITTSLSPFAVVEPLRAPLTVAGDAYTTPEDMALVVPPSGVLTNDGAASVQGVTAILLEAPAHGAVNLSDDGSFTYVPRADFHGVDTFRYAAREGSDASSPATVTITVTPVDDAPVARMDAGALDEDGTLDIAVLANDSDADGDSLAITSVSQPAHGTVSVMPNGIVRYTPAKNYFGSDSFDYVISAAHGDSASATVSIIVRAVNDPPDCRAVVADTPVLWPADHTLRSVALSGATDLDSEIVSIRVTYVTQDEPIDRMGDGDTSPDAVAEASTNQVSLRAERSGSGDGRVYVISYVASDGQATCTGQVTVAVPRNQGAQGHAVNSGQSYVSFSP